jgi:hypothetical protein
MAWDKPFPAARRVLSVRSRGPFASNGALDRVSWPVARHEGLSAALAFLVGQSAHTDRLGHSASNDRIEHHRHTQPPQPPARRTYAVTALADRLKGVGLHRPAVDRPAGSAVLRSFSISTWHIFMRGVRRQVIGRRVAGFMSPMVQAPCTITVTSCRGPLMPAGAGSFAVITPARALTVTTTGG